MTTSKLLNDLGHLPDWPLLMRAELAAAFLDLPVATFTRAVERGELPLPVRIAGRRLWSRKSLEARFEDAEPHASSPGHDPIAAAIRAGGRARR